MHVTAIDRLKQPGDGVKCRVYEGCADVRGRDECVAERGCAPARPCIVRDGNVAGTAAESRGVRALDRHGDAGAAAVAGPPREAPCADAGGDVAFEAAGCPADGAFPTGEVEGLVAGLSCRTRAVRPKVFSAVLRVVRTLVGYRAVLNGAVGVVLSERVCGQLSVTGDGAVAVLGLLHELLREV